MAWTIETGQVTITNGKSGLIRIYGTGFHFLQGSLT